MPWPCSKIAEADTPELHIYFVPPDEAETHPLTRDVCGKQDKIATAAAAASILIPIAAHAAVGLVSHVAARSNKTHVLDLQQKVLLQGCYTPQGTLLLNGSYLCLCIGGTIKENETIPTNPTVTCIWELVQSLDGNAIRLHLEKWKWNDFLQPPETSFWKCQSIKFRDVAIAIEIDYVDGTKALWEFVFSNITQEELATTSRIDATTEWAPAPNKPSIFMEEMINEDANGNNTDIDDNQVPESDLIVLQRSTSQTDTLEDEAPVNLSSEGVETPLELEQEASKTLPMTFKPAKKSLPTNDVPYYVPANICVDVIETTRPHVLAPLLAESAKAGSTVAAPLSKLVQSQFTKVKV